MNDFANAALNDDTAQYIIVTFKDGRRAKYTAAMLDLLKTDDAVQDICTPEGEALYINGDININTIKTPE